MQLTPNPKTLNLCYKQMMGAVGWFVGKELRDLQRQTSVLYSNCIGALHGVPSYVYARLRLLRAYIQGCLFVNLPSQECCKGWALPPLVPSVTGYSVSCTHVVDMSLEAPELSLLKCLNNGTLTMRTKP